MPDINHGISRLLAAPSDQPVYVTRQVGARIFGVDDRTFEKHAKPSAWRIDRNGKLQPIYDAQAVEDFRIFWVAERQRGAL